MGARQAVANEARPRTRPLLGFPFRLQPRSHSVLLAVVLGSAGLWTSGGAVAQEMDHSAHRMPMGDGSWRMPPMDPNMPMLPGLEMALPPVGAFPGRGGRRPVHPPGGPPQRSRSDGVGRHPGCGRLDRSQDVGWARDGHVWIQRPVSRPPDPSPQGSTVIVRVTNRIEFPTTVHWHGVRLDNAFDGVPGLTQPAIEVGDTFVYEVKVPDAGMFWYHPHVREDVQQDLGLYGNLLVTPPQADYYGPAHREEILVLDDILMDESGAIPWGEEAPTHALMGRFGTVMLVNGMTDHGTRGPTGRGRALLHDQRGQYPDVQRHLRQRAGEARRFGTSGASNGRPGSRASSSLRRSDTSWTSVFPDEGTVLIANSIQAVNHFRGEFYPHVDTLAVVEVSGTPADGAAAAGYEDLREVAPVVEELDPLRSHLGRAPDFTLETTVRVNGLPLPIVVSMEIDTLYVPPMEWNDAMPMMNWLATGGSGDVDSPGSGHGARKRRHRLDLRPWRPGQDPGLQRPRLLSPDEPPDPCPRTAVRGTGPG